MKYLEALKLGLDKGDKKHIFEKINEYILIFIDKSSGYLKELLEILSSLSKGRHKVRFYQIIVFVKLLLTNYIITLNFNSVSKFFLNKLL